MKVARLCLALTATLLAAPLFALPSDREKPIHISSDSADLDDNKGIAIYRGDVVMTQGSTRLTGNQITIYSKDRQVQRIVSEGKTERAYFQEQQINSKGLLQAWGMTIDYNMITGKVELIKNARLTQNGDSFTGDRIDYDQTRQLVNAKGKQGTGSESRVKMVIQPSQTK